MEDAMAAATADEMPVSKRHRPLRSDEQQAQPGGGNGAGDDLDLDLISRLPDAILGTVISLIGGSSIPPGFQMFLGPPLISLLPTKDGARTQGLSRRWLPLWRSPMAPLNLTADYKLCNAEWRIGVVRKILSDHPGPALRFSVLITSLWGTRDLDEVGGWLRSESLAGLEELQITNAGNTRYRLPPHALIRFAPTLRVLDLGSCRSRGLVAPLDFLRLKQVILFNVDISEDSLQSMISGCAVLESVSLHRSVGFGRLCISSLTLRSISFSTFRSKGVIMLAELIIENAPCLERLIPILPYYGPANIRVIRAPKLKILGFLSKGISTLCLGTTVFEEMISVSLTTKMHTVKILALDFIGANLDAVVDFLKCFPCLEKIYVIMHDGKDMNNVRKYDPLDPIECLEVHLKKVVLKNYDGNKRQFIDFAKFFILNAKVLKQIEIGVLNRESDEWMCYQRQKLQVENRASRDAEIALRSDMYATPTSYRHTYDFSTADPFE